MKHRFPNIRNSILKGFGSKIDEKLGTSELKSALNTLKEAQKQAEEENEIWDCSICGKKIPSGKYAKHYFKCYSKQVLRGKIH